MRNLKIRTKLFAGFSIVLLMLIVLGLMSFINVLSLEKVIKTYDEEVLQNTDVIWQMRSNMANIQRYMLTMIVHTDLEEIKKATSACDGYRANLVENLNELKTIRYIDLSYIEKFESKVNEAAPYRKQIYELATENTAESNALAFKVFSDKYIEIVYEAERALLDIITIQDQFVQSEKSAAQNTATAAKAQVITILLAAIVVTLIIVFIISRLIAKPISAIGKAALEVSKGNFNFNLRKSANDEIGELTDSFQSLKSTIMLLTDKIRFMSSEMDKGDIEARIDESLFEGEYQAVAASINATVNALIGDTLEMLGAFTKIGNGDFSAQLAPWPGKKAVANSMFDELKGNIVSVSEDVNSLITAAAEGRLDARVDSSKYKGDWLKITESLNHLLESIIAPINEANTVLESLANGDFSVHTSNNYKGSFARMMKSLEKMINITSTYINEITDILGKLANGDLRQNISQEYVGQYNAIKDSINNISKTLSMTISEIKISAENVLVGARQISETSMDLANGASTQASSVEELNASITTINEQTQKAAEEAHRADEVSNMSIESANNGSHEMIKMLSSMDSIKEASNSISKIIKVIDDIAFQTNLLALNAAVEAARAGEHGKGFAVVADEVRSLAARSSTAAKDTSALIEDTIAKINEGTTEAQLTANSLKKIVDDINQVSHTISAIYTSMNEQKSSISLITSGIYQISEVVQRNSSTSEEAAAAAQELNSQSEILAQMVSHFKF